MSAALPDSGLLIFAKRECETCIMVEPVLGELARAEQPVVVLTQDDPSFPAILPPIDDTALEHSFRFDVEAVPTVIRLENGKEVARTFGWNRSEWERVSGVEGTWARACPRCGPAAARSRASRASTRNCVARFGERGFKSRSIAIGEWDDQIEACFDRGWTDGLPVVPPTDARILRMLAGTARKPEEVVGNVPPNLSPVTVEKVAINAVMAGCRPEYMPVVLAALEAALEPESTMHGLLCTTCFSGPIIVVNGPIAREIGMNSGINCLGQGNRANATIGRALQLIIRNVGGGRPGELDRAMLGGPGKYTFCFAEDESDPTWMPLVGGARHRARQECRHAVPGRRHSRLHRPALAHARAAHAGRWRCRCWRSGIPSCASSPTPCWCWCPSTTHLPRGRLGPRAHHAGTACGHGAARAPT